MGVTCAWDGCRGEAGKGGEVEPAGGVREEHGQEGQGGGGEHGAGDVSEEDWEDA